MECLRSPFNASKQTKKTLTEGWTIYSFSCSFRWFYDRISLFQVSFFFSLHLAFIPNYTRVFRFTRSVRCPHYMFGSQDLCFQFIGNCVTCFPNCCKLYESDEMNEKIKMQEQISLNASRDIIIVDLSVLYLLSVSLPLQRTILHIAS